MTILEALKNAEDRAYLNLIFWDRDIQNVLLGWTMYHPAPRPEQWGEQCPESWTLKRVLGRCWRKVTLDPNRLSLLSGVPARSAIEKFERLREARLVYPDGTANAEALLIIRAQMEDKVKLAQATVPAPTTVHGTSVPPDGPVLPAVIVK